MDDANNDRVHRPPGEHGRGEFRAGSLEEMTLHQRRRTKTAKRQEQHGKPGEWQVVWNIWKEHAWGRGTGKAKQIKGPRC